MKEEGVDPRVAYLESEVAGVKSQLGQVRTDMQAGFTAAASARQADSDAISRKIDALANAQARGRETNWPVVLGLGTLVIAIVGGFFVMYFRDTDRVERNLVATLDRIGAVADAASDNARDIATLRERAEGNDERSYDRHVAQQNIIDGNMQQILQMMTDWDTRVQREMHLNDWAIMLSAQIMAARMEPVAPPPEY